MCLSAYCFLCACGLEECRSDYELDFLDDFPSDDEEAVRAINDPQAILKLGDFKWPGEFRAIGKYPNLHTPGRCYVSGKARTTNDWDTLMVLPGSNSNAPEDSEHKLHPYMEFDEHRKFHLTGALSVHDACWSIFKQAFAWRTRPTSVTALDLDILWACLASARCQHRMYLRLDYGRWDLQPDRQFWTMEEDFAPYACNPEVISGMHRYAKRLPVIRNTGKQQRICHMFSSGTQNRNPHKRDADNPGPVTRSISKLQATASTQRQRDDTHPESCNATIEAHAIAPSALQSSEPDHFAHFPLELRTSICLHLPSSSLSRVFQAYPSMAEVDRFPWFWRRRFEANMPWAWEIIEAGRASAKAVNWKGAYADMKAAARPHSKHNGWRTVLDRPANAQWLGLANRKRIWDVCQQLMDLYVNYELQHRTGEGQDGEGSAKTYVEECCKHPEGHEGDGCMHR